MLDNHMTLGTQPDVYTPEEERLIDAAIAERAKEIERTMHPERRLEIEKDELAALLTMPMPYELQEQIDEAGEHMDLDCLLEYAATVFKGYLQTCVNQEIAQVCEAQAQREFDEGRLTVEGVNDE